MSIYDSSTRTLAGEPTTLARFQGKVTLIVNVASECGLTPQYAGLERLQQRYRERGFSVLGFPSNDFGGQEPGTPQQIQQFCTTRYNASFPLFEKVRVKNGAEQAPLYTALNAATGSTPNWNFGKYLVARNGDVIKYFAPQTEPEDAELVRELEAALSTPA